MPYDVPEEGPGDRMEDDVRVAHGACEELKGSHLAAPQDSKSERSIREEIEQNGFFVVRDALTGSEIEHLKLALKEHFKRYWRTEGLGKHQPNAAVAIPKIGSIFSNAKLLNAFRQAFGHEQLVFTGNCDAHMNMLSWWHKDTSEGSGGCFSGNYFQNRECRVFRAGVYLQDQTHRGGLTVRVGSHYSPQLTAGTSETIKTKAGDVIIFDIRLTHAGQFADPIEKLILRTAGKARADKIGRVVRAAYSYAMRKPEKLSIFFTFGSPGFATDEYCRFELKAKQSGAGASDAYLNDELVAALEAKGVSCFSGMTRPSQAIVLQNSI
jgi:hypothetical protein